MKIIYIVLFCFLTNNCSGSIVSESDSPSDYPPMIFGPDIMVNRKFQQPTDHSAEGGKIVLDHSGNVYFAWEEDRQTHELNIYFRKSNDEGGSFEPEFRIDPQNNSSQLAADMSLDTDGNIYIVWVDDRNNTADIYFSKSVDGGITFCPSVQVDASDTSTVMTILPKIAVDSLGVVYVVWNEHRIGLEIDIYIAKSVDGGLTFSQAVIVSTEDGDSWGPSISIDSNNYVYVAYNTYWEGTSAIYCTRCTNGGLSFDVHTRVDDAQPENADSWWVDLSIDDNDRLYAVWMDKRNDYHIYSSKSIDGGLSFTENVQVSGTEDIYPREPKIVAKNDHISVVWIDRLEQYSTRDVYFSESYDGGTAFQERVLVNDSNMYLSTQHYPNLDVDESGKVFVVWSDDRNMTSTIVQRDIYFSVGTRAVAAPSLGIKGHSILVILLGLIVFYSCRFVRVKR